MQNEIRSKSVDQFKGQLGRRKMMSKLGSAGAIAALGVWSKPALKQVVLPAHAQMSTMIPPSVFMAGSYEFQFPNGGVQNTTDCDANSVNAGRTLTSGIGNFAAEIGTDGSFTAGVLTSLIGTDTISNVIAMDGSINFNDTFQFTDPTLGACETEVTIVGTAAGTSISGSVEAEVRCAGCVSGFQTTFTASPAT